MSSNEEKSIAEIDKAILEAYSICRGVSQRYLAYIQNVDVDIMFPNGVQPTNEIGFLDKNKKQWFMKLEIVDDMDYQFPAHLCPGKAVGITMQKIMISLPAICKIVLEQEVRPEDVPRPELFMDSALRITPYMSAFLYNKTFGRELHDQFKKRIAFVWSEGVELPPQVIDVKTAATEHPDNFTGPQNAKNITDTDANSLIEIMNALTPKSS